MRLKVKDICPQLEEKKESNKAYQAFTDFCLIASDVTDLFNKYMQQSQHISPPSRSLNTLRTWHRRFEWEQRRDIFKYESSKLREEELYNTVELIRDKWVAASQLAIDRATEMMRYPLVEKEVVEVIEIAGVTYDKVTIIKPLKWNSSVAPAYLNASVNMANSVIGDLTAAIETCRRFGYEVISKDELIQLKNGISDGQVQNNNLPE